MLKAMLCAVGLGLAVSGPAVAQETGVVIQEDRKIVAPDAARGDLFGFPVALHGGTLAVGAIQDDDNGASSGSVYVLEASTGELVDKLTPDDGGAGDFFGVAIDLDERAVLVGAYRAGTVELLSGSAYLFDVGTGEQLHKLVPSDAAGGDEFGRQVAISGDSAVVAAWLDGDNGQWSGSAYVFDIDTGQEQKNKLLAMDGAPGDNLGLALSADAGVALAGAWRDDDNGFESGSAYLFDVATGEQLRKLLADDGRIADHFGRSVAIGDAYVLVGAFSKDEAGVNSGAVYVFDRASGVQLDTLSPDDAEVGIEFGWAVAVSGRRAVIGARYDNDNGIRSGSAYVFDLESGEQIAKLLPSDGAAEDLFGSNVAIDGRTVVVGASGNDEAAEDAGAVYVFTAPTGGGDCPADWDGNGIVNAADVGAFLSDYFLDLLNGTLVADFNEDGVVNAADVGAFLSEYFPDQGDCL